MLTSSDPSVVMPILRSIGAYVYLVDVLDDGSFRYFAANWPEESNPVLPYKGSLIGRRPEKILDAETAERAIRNYRQCVQQRASVQFEGSYEAAGGRRWTNHFLSPLFDLNGRLVRIMGTIIDITEQKLAEQKLYAKETQLSMIYDGVYDSIFVISVEPQDNFRFISVNRRFLDASGLQENMVVGRLVSEVIPEPSLSLVLDKYKEAVRSGRPVQWQELRTYPSGEKVGEFIIAPVFDARGTCTQLMGTVHDVTELKRAQKNLQSANEELEIKVRDRTRELTSTNEALNVEISERKQAAKQIKMSHQLSDALNDLNAVIHSTLDFEEIMKRVVKEAALAIKVDGPAIGLIRDSTFEIRYVHDRAAHMTGWAVPVEQLTGVSAAVLSGEPVAFSDTLHDQRVNLEFARKWGYQSMLVAPLVIRQRLTGALVFYSFARLFEFRQEHIDFARKLAASISLALENAELYQAGQTRGQLLKALLSSISDLAWLKDEESRYILVNGPFEKASGRSSDEIIGKTDFDVWPRELAEKYRADDREVMQTHVPKRMEEPLAPAEGEIRWVETIKTPIYGEEGAVIGTAGIGRDTTERKRMEEEIRHFAHHDALTGLPNRRMFLDILNLEMAQARRHGSKLAILFLDLDRFKEINDTLGHEAGDRLLAQVASRFRGTIRQSDTVARIGGDEFNMILADIVHPEGVSDIALKIVNSLRAPVVIDAHELHVTTSVGISIYPDDGEDADTLLRYADIAMYHAKEEGRNTFRFYNPDINVRSADRVKLEGYLRQALKRRELSVLYQPQIDIRSGNIAYAEALVRWNHPVKGFLDPNEFIPFAEETGFITSIDEWVLREACAQAVKWREAGLEPVCITVNLSAREFEKPDLVERISSILKETRMEPGCLDLEVTESTAMSDVDRTASQLRQLREMGVHVSIDDFGTGYSSLNYLKKLPIERLKIDKSFISDIAHDPDDRAIISAVACMARKMGIRTVAEGVETKEQLAFLRDTECDEAQGFLFSRPVSAREFEALIASR